jgi:hypothetical protein
MASAVEGCVGSMSVSGAANKSDAGSLSACQVIWSGAVWLSSNFLAIGRHASNVPEKWIVRTGYHNAICAGCSVSVRRRELDSH